MNGASNREDYRADWTPILGDDAMPDEERLAKLEARLDELKDILLGIVDDVQTLIRAQTADATRIEGLQTDVARAQARLGKVERAAAPDETEIVKRANLERDVSDLKGSRDDRWVAFKWLAAALGGGMIALIFQWLGKRLGIG